MRERKYAKMKKALVIGSINVDKVYEVEHIARPGETVSSRKYRTAWGGKGLNQAIALCRGGAETALAGCTGMAESAALAAFCAPIGLDTGRVRARECATGHAIIQVDENGQNCIIVEPGANGTVCPEDIAAFLDGYGAGDVLLTQNEISRMPEVLREAHEKGMTVALNPSPFTAEILSWPLECVDIFIVNETEGRDLTGESEPLSILDAMQARFPAASVVLTRGEHGSEYAGGGRRFHTDACRVKAVDTTAAGDTFTGFFLGALLRGELPEDAMALAARASAVAVTRPGAAPSIPRLEEVI